MTINPNIKSEDMDEFVRGMLSLRNEEECYMFLEDICTIAELTAIAQRLKVAKLLRGKKTCHEISESTKISTATISRVNKCLHYGSGGYALVLDRLAEE